MCRYLRRYEKLIAHYRSVFVEGYVEKHHITPLCLGGTDDLSNLVALPPRAHYLAHYFLWKAYPNEVKLAHAFAMMAVNNPYQHRIMNGKLYELSKIARSSALKGKKLSEETKQKMRKPKSSSHRLKLLGNTNAKGNAGKSYTPRTQDHREKLALSQKAYHEQRTAIAQEKMIKYRKEFAECNMTRKEFAEKNNVNYTTMKKYLTGL